MNSESLDWRDDLPAQEWDKTLARLGGHPLQSCHWGEARNKVDGIPYLRLAGFRGGRAICLARAEVRKIPLAGNLAWLPRGPTITNAVNSNVNAALQQELERRGFILAAASPWQRAGSNGAGQNEDRPKTIWIDLNVAMDVLWAGLQKKWRHGVGYAERHGVTVRRTRAGAQVRSFFGSCEEISQIKGFKLPASPGLMETLIACEINGGVTSHLFVASVEGAFAAGAFIIRCGNSIHYLWGTTNRTYSKLRPSEAVHWAVIEWALDEGCELYDLEGIDPVGNPGVAAFKRKMGGEEVVLQSPSMVPMTMTGKFLAPLVMSRVV